MGDKKRINKYLGMIDDFGKKRILVVGDVMLDEYIWGDCDRISPEAPVPVVVIRNRTYHPGGAANTVSNILSLGAKACLVGVIGRDNNARRLKKILKDSGIDADHLVADPARPTTCKVRIVASGQQVMRADQEESGPVGDRVTKKMIGRIEELAGRADGIAVSDYSKGVIGPALMSNLINTAKEAGKVIAADIKPKNMQMFKGVTVITPNRKEASQLAGMDIRDEKTLREAGLKIKETMGLKAVLVTLGESGMALFNTDEEMKVIPAVSTQVYDVTGAGDTVLSVMTVSLSCGHSFKDAMALSNFAAGVVVRKRGTTAVDRDELKDFIKVVLA